MSSVLYARFCFRRLCPGSLYNKSYRSISTEDKSTQNIVHSPFKDISFSETSVPEFVFKDFGKYPNKTAVECYLTGRRYTFEELRRKSKNFGKALRKKFKLTKGDVVALLLPNIPEFPICVLGSLDAGLVVTSINTAYKPGEIKTQLLDSNSKVVITIGQFWPLMQTALNELHNSIPTIIIKESQSETLPNGAINFQELVDTEYDIADLKNFELDDFALLPYSSGTSGLPKGVEISNRNILSNLAQLSEPLITLPEATTENHQDVIPGILPWFHIYGLTAILLTNLKNLSKLVTMPKFSPDTYVNMLETHKPHILFLVPPLVIMMNNSTLIKKEHLQQVHTICSGGAPLGRIEEEKLQRKADKEIHFVQGYGLTESSCCVTYLSRSRKKQFQVFGSVGEPVGNTSIKIVPTDNVYGEPLGANQRGELLIKGPQMIKAYHNKPQETKDSYIDGWFRSGDIGYYDTNRFFYITDRLKELIKVQAFQVAPAELEEVIRTYPGVLDSAVIGIPHKKFGEVPRAYIVLEKGSNLDIKKLREFVNSKVADYKRLSGGIVVLGSIPKTASGKILRKDLKLLAEREM